MVYLFYFLTVLAFLAGVGILAGAKSAIHDIEAFVLFLIATVFLSGAGMLGAMTRLREDLTALVSLRQRLSAGD